jgi:cytochrome P450
MLVRANAPMLLNGLGAAHWYLRFLRDPLQAMLWSEAEYGSFVQLPHPPFIANGRRAFVVAVGADFNREVLGNPSAWRTVSVGPGGPKNSAVRRLETGLIRMNGRPHEHYRRLVVPPLQHKRIDALGADMARIAEDEIGSWPRDQVIDLWMLVRKLLRTFAIGLLFGDDRSRGFPITNMLDLGIDLNWSVKVAACPLNLPGTPYWRMLRGAELLERRIIEWADCKRGHVDERDLLSVVVNNPDEDGHPASNEKIVGQTPTLLTAAYETCQNALIWTLMLLDQHPSITRDLFDELQSAGASSNFDKLMQLPLLDSVVKESMRILPPVPQQFRVAQHDATLAGYPVPKKTRVLLSPLLTNRDSDLYPEADRFIPMRWATINPSAYEYLVFSAGPRGCPGYWFGLCAVKVAIAAILARYRVSLVPGARIDYKVRLALSPRRGVPAILKRQDGAFSAAPIRGGIRNLVQLPNAA